MQAYIKAKFGYNYTSTVIEVQIPAIMGPNSAILEVDHDFNSILQDITDEIRKFGALRQFFVNGEGQREVFLVRQRDLSLFGGTILPSAIGKAFVEFEAITSAFACYNLLNGKKFMGLSVEINFVDRDQFLTKKLA